MGEGVDGEDEEDEEEEDSYDSDDIGSNDEIEVDVCPHDCEATIFSKVIALRGKKLDEEDILAEIQKLIEVLKKENDSLIKKEKVYLSNYQLIKL
jgi:hypothetical protein